MGEPSDVSYLRQRLAEGEEILFFLEGYIGDLMGSGSNTQYNGALVLTTKRVAFVSKRLFGLTLEEVFLEKVSSLEQRQAGLFKALVVHTSGNKIEFKTAGNREGFVAAYHKLTSAHAPHQPAPTVQMDPIAQLERLAKLRDAGVLTDAEFQSKKAEMLARL